MKNAITIIRSIPTLLVLLPRLLVLVSKIRELADSDQAKAVIKAVSDFFDRCDDLPSDSKTITQHRRDQREDRRKRFVPRVITRLTLAGRLSDKNVTELCTENYIQPYTEKTE